MVKNVQGANRILRNNFWSLSAPELPNPHVTLSDFFNQVMELPNLLKYLKGTVDQKRLKTTVLQMNRNSFFVLEVSSINKA